MLQRLRSNWLAIAAGLIALAVWVIYTFFGSMGTWTSWPETSRYYDDLGAAFRAGRLDLHIQPPASLLSLPAMDTERSIPFSPGFSSAWLVQAC